MAPAYMHKAIRTADKATAFVKALNADGKLFHFDDSPETIVSCASGLPTFTEEECELIDLRVAEMFAIDGFNPFEVALALVGHVMED